MTAKRYLCFFTCASSQAVHLEEAFLLDTASFLNAFFQDGPKAWQTGSNDQGQWYELYFSRQRITFRHSTPRGCRINLSSYNCCFATVYQDGRRILLQAACQTTLFSHHLSAHDSAFITSLAIHRAVLLAWLLLTAAIEPITRCR